MIKDELLWVPLTNRAFACAKRVKREQFTILVSSRSKMVHCGYQLLALLQGRASGSSQISQGDCGIVAR